MMKTIDVPEFEAHRRCTVTLDEAVRRAITATRNSFGRQLAWWLEQYAPWQKGAQAKELTA